MKITPMLQQYLDAKQQHPDSLLLFRMGDFYELFFEDAKTASDVLDITLTSRNRGAPDEIPMAGVPHHAASGYIQRLVRAGHKVAICEQMEDPAQAKGIVARDVVRVITPGVVLDLDESQARESHFLAAVWPVSRADGPHGFALCDVTTGEIRLSEVASPVGLGHELSRAGAREVLVSDQAEPGITVSLSSKSLHVTRLSKNAFSLPTLGRRLRELQAVYATREHRSAVLAPDQGLALVEAVPQLGLRHPEAAAAALSGLLYYVAELERGLPSHLALPTAQRPQDHVALDAATEANLEIFEALIGGGRSGSLLSVIDCTVTAAGARQLRTRLAYPLTEVAKIRHRLDGVEALTRSEVRRGRIREQLREVADIPRLTGRAVTGGATPRDVVALGRSLAQIPGLLALADSGDPLLLRETFAGLDPCTDLRSEIERGLVEDPPLSAGEGRVFRSGYHAELDELMALTQSGTDWLLGYEQSERTRTSIDSLKVRYNKVFGYYIEITKSNLHRVPDGYIRKQTLAGGERFFTLELKEYEDKILHAQERRSKLEARLFAELVRRISEAAPVLNATASALAQLDVLAALAELAIRQRYVRPTVDDSRVTRIIDGRHPVVERTQAAERFVPNSVVIDSENEQLLIVTGPNMAGKSTIIRQVALITLLGQIGSFVPAKEASLGVVDQIFSRVGASDNLAQGQSTFMVEMTQTAHILSRATPQSLIILDEIGRGTSTFDGLSIAWAVGEFLCDSVGARTMFATHYHELTELAKTRPRVKNVSVAVKEWNDDIVFLRRLVDGPANQSYGIQVGRLAGLPQSVVQRAKQVLANLEAAAYTPGGEPVPAVDPAKPAARRPPQLDLFGPALPPNAARVLAEIEGLDPEALSPREALETLFRMRAALTDVPRRKPV